MLLTCVSTVRGEMISASAISRSVRPSASIRSTSFSRGLRVCSGPSLPVVYTGEVPDPFRQGREVIVSGSVHDGTFIGKRDSLITKCPSKFKAAPNGQST